MKPFLLLLLVLGSPASWAADQACNLENSIVATLYNDAEFRRYACPPEGICPAEEFSTLVELRGVSLNYDGGGRDTKSCLASTKIKGRQFPTLVFTLDKSQMKLVLADYESGLSVAKSGKKGMYDLIGLAHPEANRLEKNFYSWNGREYFLRKTECFKVVGKKRGTSAALVSRPCDK